MLRPLVAVIISLALVACDKPPAPRPDRPAPSAQPAAPPSGNPATAAQTPLPEVPWRFETSSRLIAIGDVHGDLAATRAALRLGGLIDAQDDWTGGDATLVQTGDVLDRGDDEQAILDLLMKLQEQAALSGGRVHLLSGNHELMNAAGDFRYVTPGGFRDFDDVAGLDTNRPELARVPSSQRARAAAFLPGGFYARKLAPHPVAIVVGDSVFAHGGVLPKHVRYGLDRMNAEVSAWMLGQGKVGMMVVKTPDSPVWSRHYSDQPDASDCAKLKSALGLLKAKRMVVGHTVQPQITTACDEQVWRVDVGMAKHYGGHPEVLEITASGVRAIRSSEGDD